MKIATADLVVILSLRSFPFGSIITGTPEFRLSTSQPRGGEGSIHQC